jgi:predicted metal-dependent hydrolase
MQKIISIDELDTPVVLARRRGTKHLKITLKNNGDVRLTVPWLITEKQAREFLLSKIDWIEEHRKKPSTVSNGQHIGKSHRLVIRSSHDNRYHTRVANNEIIISIPQGINESHPTVQKHATKAIERALKQEASNLLPQRLEFLANKYDYSYNSVTVKKLSSRWGSCDNHKNIILSFYLMQLDWSLIDYVIVHELVHTVHQHHQAEFWHELEHVMPDCKERRKTLKQFGSRIL